MGSKRENKKKNKPRKRTPRNVVCFFRLLGPGGSYLTFFPTKEGCKIIAENECSTEESSLSKEDLEYLLGVL
jgi:hypothetical protein